MPDFALELILIDGVGLVILSEDAEEDVPVVLNSVVDVASLLQDVLEDVVGFLNLFGFLLQLHQEDWMDLESRFRWLTEHMLFLVEDFLDEFLIDVKELVLLKFVQVVCFSFKFEVSYLYVILIQMEDVLGEVDVLDSLVVEILVVLPAEVGEREYHEVLLEELVDLVEGLLDAVVETAFEEDVALLDEVPLEGGLVVVVVDLVVLEGLLLLGEVLLLDLLGQLFDGLLDTEDLCFQLVERLLHALHAHLLDPVAAQHLALHGLLELLEQLELLDLPQRVQDAVDDLHHRASLVQVSNARRPHKVHL